MTGPFADRLFRIAFALAGCYNLAFGLWAAVWPLAFFALFDIPPPRYPGIWACLGMVVGVYGLLYLHAAWKLETARPIITVGLLGKVLGPIGMVMSFGDDWPRRLGMICIYNDLIWWLPFGLFLVRGTWLGRRLAALAPWFCVAVHAAAVAMLGVFLQPGTLIQPDALTRGQYIASQVTAWTIGWSLWMLAAMSLVGFYAWWGSQLAVGQAFQLATRFKSSLAGGADARDERQAGKPAPHGKIAILAVLIAALGLVCDFSGEGSAILRLVERVPAAGAIGSAAARDIVEFTRVERCFTLLSAGAANALYTIGGIILTMLTPNLPRWVRGAMWLTWLAGVVMTIAAIANHLGGMVVSTAVLFPLLLIWVAWMGARWRRT